MVLRQGVTSGHRSGCVDCLGESAVLIGVDVRLRGAAQELLEGEVLYSGLPLS
jgi:hypothetical protein